MTVSLFQNTVLSVTSVPVYLLLPHQALSCALFLSLIVFYSILVSQLHMRCDHFSPFLGILYFFIFHLPIGFKMNVNFCFDHRLLFLTYICLLMCQFFDSFPSTKYLLNGLLYNYFQVLKIVL